MDRMRLGVRAGSHNNNKKRNKKIGGAQGWKWGVRAGFSSESSYEEIGKKKQKRKEK